MTVDFVSPRSVDAAVAELRDGRSTVIAGGVSLVAVMNDGRARPERFVSTANLAPSRPIRFEPRGEIVIGAGATHAQIATDPQVRSALPELAATFAKIGNPRVRAWGTIGGNLVAGDPRHDGPPLLAAMGAHGIVVNAGGQHRAEVARLVSGLDPRDLLTEIRIPAPGAGEGIGFEKLFYSAGDYALVSAAVGLRLATDGQVAAARLALSGAAFGCAQVVLVQPPNPGPGLPIDVVRAAAERAAAEAPAVDDFRGSADYKRHVAEVLLARALAAAGARAEARGELS